MKHRIYLDYAATTPVLPEVAEEMKRVMLKDFGNPSALYQEGRDAKASIQQARKTIAAYLNAPFDEIFFTSGATESNFLALHGMAQGLKKKGSHLITSQIEHSSVLGACKSLEQQGFKITYLPVDSDGIISSDVFRNAIQKDTILASVMLANNETGTIQPIEEMAAIAKEFNIAFHTDAVAALPSLPLDFKALGVDALSISAHKAYAPKGSGALALKKGMMFEAPVQGGEQERKVRPGTENTAGIAAFAKAIEILSQQKEEEMKRISALRDYLKEQLFKKIPGCILNGHPQKRLPNNLNISFPEGDGESILIHLDLQGIACSMGSACSAGALEPSHVLMALGRSRKEAKCSIRFSLGKFTREEDIESVVGVLPPFVKKLQTEAMAGL